LLKQEKGLEGMGDKYLGLALLQAGAAMMTTPGGIGMALGKGVQVGSERYIQGMEKINAAKDKFADARDRLDDLRLNRSDMNARDIKDAKKEARTLERQAEALFYTGAREDLKMTDKNLTTLLGLAADQLKTKDQQAFEATQTEKKLKSAKDIAAIGEGGANARSAAQIAATLNTPDRLVFDKLLKDSGGDAVKAAEALQKLKTEKFNVYDSYSKYLAGFAGKDPAMVGAPESITKYASRFAALTPPAPVDTNKPTRP
jgi:hypothetical protein